MGQDDQALLDALQRKDRLACDEMVQRFSKRVYHVALRLVGAPEEAEEVMQDTFINACRSVDSFEGRSGLGTWLHRIATNNGLMRLRRHEAPTVPLEAPTDEGDGDFHPINLRDWRWDPESEALTTELRSVMQRAIDSLPETLRVAFVLRDLEGLSTDEAAGRLGITPQALKVRLHRARLLLRERLADYFTEKPYAPGGSHE